MSGSNGWLTWDEQQELVTALCDLLGERFDNVDGVVVVGYRSKWVDEDRGLKDVTPEVIQHFANQAGAICRHDGGTLLIMAGGLLHDAEGGSEH